MRLKNIRISGFKSFVEPTEVALPGMFSCIVGPNGCGKSNIVDAVRWVIGESSSRQLRSDSMADVIFNGTAERKALSRAAVELLLDNSDGALGGAYTKYAEILVRREVHRDGESQYSINGTRCRRRDVVDIFLGTGLGPHSYAIIEQGMIARVVDARPEELRVLLEEAAGVSRYRERRREAERRIRNTRQNMERLEDLLGELASRLRHLKQQSGAAGRYARYRERERRAQADLCALRMRGCLVRMEILQRELRARQNRAEKATAALRGREKEIESLRSRRDADNRKMNQAQADLYEINADTVRTEEAIRSRRERDAQLNEALEAAQRTAEELETQLADDRRQLEQWEEQMQALERRLQECARKRESAAAALEDAQRAERECAARRDEARLRHLQAAHQLEQRRSRSELLEAESEQLATQMAQRSAEPESESEPEQTPASELEAARKHCAKLEKTLRASAQALEKSRAALDAAERSRREAAALFERSSGRSAALEALLQQREEQAHSEEMDAWLKKLPAGEAQSLSAALRIDAGWEIAAELALSAAGAALCVEDLPALAARLRTLPAPEAVEFVQSSPAKKTAADGKWTPLARHVRAPFSLEPLLGGVYAAENATEALHIWPQLQTGEAVVAPEGLWLAPGRARVAGGAAGALRLRSALEDSVREQKRAKKTLAAAEKDFTGAGAALEKSRAQHDKDRQALEEAVRRSDILTEREARWRQSQSQRAQMRQMLEQARERRERISAELAQLLQGREESEAALRESAAACDRIETERSGLAEQRERAQREFTAAEDALQAARLESEGLAARREEVRMRQAQFERQLQAARTQREELQSGLQQSGQPLKKMDQTLERQLAQRAAAEKKLKKARDALAAAEQRQREAEGARDAQAHEIEALREAVQQTRLELATTERDRDAAAEKIAALGLEAEAVLTELPEDAREEELERQAERLRARIERIGPVNLAAAEEYRSESERREHLDKQYGELDQTLGLLEKSIRDIDRETQRLFQDAFARVNEGLEATFPRLFGGGRAQLAMEEGDLLRSGVRMMARPPGKRNTGVQQLSGGEKTLAALALILAIFRLNPAPFCILDEVDAPLDDANIARFVQLISEICEQVQIVCVTHNKITMEDAQSLLGVTMAEQGVSRVVSVDIAAATRMAEPAAQRAAG